MIIQDWPLILVEVGTLKITLYEISNMIFNKKTLKTATIQNLLKILLLFIPSTLY